MTVFYSFGSILRKFHRSGCWLKTMKHDAPYWINSRNPKAINKQFFSLICWLKINAFAFSYKFNFMRQAECVKVTLRNLIGLKLKFIYGPHRNFIYFLANMNRVMVSLFYDYRSLGIISQQKRHPTASQYQLSDGFLVQGIFTLANNCKNPTEDKKSYPYLQFMEACNYGRHQINSHKFTRRCK